MAALLCSSGAVQSKSDKASLTPEELGFYKSFSGEQKPIFDSLKITKTQKSRIDSLIKVLAHRRLTSANDPHVNYYTGLRGILTHAQYVHYFAELSVSNIIPGAVSHLGQIFSEEFGLTSVPEHKPTLYQWQQALGSDRPNTFVGPDGSSKTFWTGSKHMVSIPSGIAQIRVRSVDELGSLTQWKYQKAELTLNREHQELANSNARVIATVIQGSAISTGHYNTNLAAYATDLGGNIPVNPCTGTSTGYSISATKSTAIVSAQTGTKCGVWSPTIFKLSL